MKDTKSKISMKQLSTVFLIAISSPIIRLIPKNVSQVAKQGSIIAPIIAIIPFVILMYVLYSLMGKGKENSLQDVYIKVFGKVIGKIILFINMIWIFVLVSLYVRYFSDRVASSILIFTPINVFVLTILATVFWAVRSKLERMARVIEFFLIAFSIIIIILFFVALIDIKIENIYPITIFDVWDAVKSTPILLAILCYSTFMFFLGDEVKDKENYLKQKFFLISRLLFLATTVVIATIGNFGYKLAPSFSLPFFMFLKNVEVLRVIARIESIFISVWFVTDFALITTFAFAILKISKKTFNLSNEKALSNPVAAGIMIFALYLANDVFELQKLSTHILIPGNIAVAVGIPVVALIIGKIRKVI
jgi:spore germination protein KB